MKMTAQEYGRRVQQNGPPSPLAQDCLWAFLVGGGICLFGELLRQQYLALGMEGEQAAALTSCTLVAGARGADHPGPVPEAGGKGRAGFRADHRLCQCRGQCRHRVQK